MSICVAFLWVFLALAACRFEQLTRFFFDTGVATTSTGEGSIASGSSTKPGLYPSGTPFSVKAAPETGSLFTGWYSAREGGVLKSTENPYRDSLRDHTNLFVRFDKDITRFDLSSWESVGTAGWGMRVALDRLPQHFRVWNASEGSVEMDVLGLVYIPPLRRNPDTLEWETAYAEDFEIAPDATSVTITLREGLRWSDGEPLTAEDFVFAAYVYQSADVKDVARSLAVNGEQTVWSVSGDREYTVATDGQSYGSLLEIASIPPLPKHLLDPYDILEFSTLNDIYGLNTNPEDVVGNGPFVLVEIELGKWVTLKKNPYYFEMDSGGLPLPYLSAIRFVGGSKIDLFNRDDAELSVVSGTTRQYITRADAAEDLLYDLGWTDTDIGGIRKDVAGNPPVLTLIAPSGNTRIAALCNIANVSGSVVHPFSGLGWRAIASRLFYE